MKIPSFKNPLSMLCGALALVCLLSFFMPIIAPQFSSSFYRPGSDSYTKDYFLIGDYYVAREYWSIAKYALSCGHRISLSVATAMLLYWATMSFMGEEAKFSGVVASTVSVSVSVYLIVEMLKVSAGCRWGVVVVLIIDMVVALVVAWAKVGIAFMKKYGDSLKAYNEAWKKGIERGRR